MILLTGGAGYIGSHIAKCLLTHNEPFLIVDNLSTGSYTNIQRLNTLGSFEFIEMDMANAEGMDALFKRYTITTIIHCAASTKVEESIQHPLKYYLNNTNNTTYLIQQALKYSVEKFIFSSTATVYGNTQLDPSGSITETMPTCPINPYGRSKLMSEQMIQDSLEHSTVRYAIFRYFNVCGASVNPYKPTEPFMGQCDRNPTHLMTLAAQCASGKRNAITIYGQDYPTPDGTCIRDYVHVEDVALAHWKAIEYLNDHNSDCFNIGYNKGYSVKEVIDTMKSISPTSFTTLIGSKRNGDPMTLIANNTKLKTSLNWKPQFDDLDLLCRSAYHWDQYRDK